MTKKRRHTLASTLSLLAIALFICYGCKNTAINSMDAYLKWLNAPENGLKSEKTVNGIRVEIKYLPPEYMVYNELDEATRKNKHLRDSLIKNQEKLMVFAMIIGPADEQGKTNDIMYDGLTKYKEYVERVQTMNFDMQRCVRLNTDKFQYEPVLSNLENIYGLKKSRKIIFVFAPEQTENELLEAKNYDFIYNDDMFELGILHFRFDKKAINKIPQITFW